MYTYIMNDLLEEQGPLLFPVWILGKGDIPLRVFIGRPLTEKFKYLMLNDNYYGIYINRIDYDLLDHTKPYILIHEEIIDEDLLEAINTVPRSGTLVDGEHYHITKLTTENTTFCNESKEE